MPLSGIRIWWTSKTPASFSNGITSKAHVSVPIIATSNEARYFAPSRPSPGATEPKRLLSFPINFSQPVTHKAAVEKANQLVGGWPEDDVIISLLEGMGINSPAGYVYIRPDNHQGYKDAVIGMTKNDPQFDFPVWDPKSIITIPIRDITAPPNWPKPGTSHNESTAAANWLKTTWLT